MGSVIKTSCRLKLSPCNFQEAEPLHIFVSSALPKAFADASKLAQNLIDTVRAEHAKAYPYPPAGGPPTAAGVPPAYGAGPPPYGTATPYGAGPYGYPPPTAAPYGYPPPGVGAELHWSLLICCLREGAFRMAASFRGFFSARPGKQHTRKRQLMYTSSLSLISSMSIRILFVKLHSRSGLCFRGA